MANADKELVGLVNIVREHKGVSPIESISDEMLLREDLGFESLDLAELTVRIEERFGVDVFADGVVHTWGEIAERVQRALEEQGTES